jgi:hypothetical protein
MGKPIGHQQSVELARCAVIEADNKFATVRSEALQRMRITGRKIPDIALLDVGNIGAAQRIDHGHPAVAVSHVRPLGRLMPMQLADAAGRQSHIDAGDGCGNCEVRLGHLPRPAAVLNAALHGIEGRPDLRHAANVGWRRGKCRLQLIPDCGILRPGSVTLAGFLALIAPSGGSSGLPKEPAFAADTVIAAPMAEAANRSRLENNGCTPDS